MFIEGGEGGGGCVTPFQYDILLCYNTNIQIAHKQIFSMLVLTNFPTCPLYGRLWKEKSK